LKSPNEQVELQFEVRVMGDQEQCPVYSVSHQGDSILKASKLGLIFDNGVQLDDDLVIQSTQFTQNNSQWRPVYGERSQVRDHYNQMTVSLSQGDDPAVVLELIFRCYDQGVAFCYRLPATDSKKAVRIEEELSQFAFEGDYLAWCVYSAQGKYAVKTIDTMGRGVERPLTLKTEDDLYIAIAEAGLVDYARMKLRSDETRPHTIVSDLSGDVNTSLPTVTPWRVIMFGESPGQLLENNDLILNLNAPNAIEDTSWIRPGKVIREVTLTTQGGKACVDFAVEHQLQYVEFDAGWYGPENSEASDARTVTLDPARSPGPLDLPEVIRYASERDIGILLYVNRRALERQLDELLPLYQDWGIKGLKYGFVNVGSQKATAWLHQAIRKAADHQLMVDVHDEYRPTGYSRTYPNFMTQEGIGGDETAPTNEQTLTILFTRMLAGAGDNTICYYDDRVKRNASHAYQLAKAVCFYSPWQFIYWYDRPQGSPRRKGGAGGQKGVIGDEPELEFYDHVPTVWDETKVIHGAIGEYAVLARRSGDEWFIGSMNNGERRTLPVPLDFLIPGKTYVAHVYSDDPAINTRTHVRIDRYRVDSETVFKTSMSAQGGQAIRIVPARTDDTYPQL
jgi:alpha-glucosidase